MSGSTGLMTGNFNSTNGKDHLVYGYILPQDGPVRGIVQISHGMAEHFGRYTDFARYLAGEGIAVYGHDLSLIHIYTLASYLVNFVAAAAVYILIKMCIRDRRDILLEGSLINHYAKTAK